jgi:hypothetical protein
MAELVDALISGVSGETRADSNSVVRTIKQETAEQAVFCFSWTHSGHIFDEKKTLTV